MENGLKNGDTIKLILTSPTSSSKSISSISFPTLDEPTNRRFVIHLKILKLIKNQLESGQVISKRQLYYMDVNLFRNQAVVDKCIDKLADCLGLSIEQLKIAASQKGLVYSQLSLNSYLISRNIGTSLIPRIGLTSKPSDFKIVFNNDKLEQPKSIIILEKDAILSGLVNREKQSTTRLFDKSILITGRGFPDRLTKHFVYILSRKFNNVPFLGYFDADIYGWMIAREYKCKPIKSLSTFNVSCCPELNIRGANLFPNNYQSSKVSQFIKLTHRDVYTSLLQLQNLPQNFDISITELQRSLFFGIKRELQLDDIIADFH